ncbi:hypothetical protein K440DRAFT_589269 [Wilcoxina mikolae CBS 423.85]|nr:hypothetical protein K440DRAFT_589269 [Wilcoxina mikolae CBS 423.85]
MVVVVIATIFALAWMFYRVSSLLNIPIPTLVKILGLDLPAPPRVSLHGISADTITLHWSLPEKAGSVAKHIIQINGINVGESEKRGETSVTVTGLNPDQRYNVRVIAANAQNFQAPGQLIRLRTCTKLQNPGESSNGVHKGDSSDDAPSVHPTPDVPPSPHHLVHNSHGQNHSRRSTRERRSSPAVLEQNHYLHNHTTSAQEDQHTVESLTRDLDAVRKEIQETEAQLAHTEEEFKAVEVVLKAELDTLKDKKNEEDAGRQRIRAETKSLEEARRTAEAMRTRTEKSLRAKEYDIKRMQGDIARWDEEKQAALEKVEGLSNAAEQSKANAAATEKELSNDIQEAQRQISEMEDEIRSLVTAMKNLETQREQLKAEEDEEAQKIREDSEKENMWRDRQRNLEMRYVTVYNAFQVAEIEFIRSREVLVSFQGRRESGSGGDAMQKKPKQRRNRNRKSRTSTVSSLINGYPLHEFGFQDSGFNNVQFQQNSPTFSNSTLLSPFFNIANGTVTGPSEIPGSIPGPIMDYLDADSDYISGTPMSPTANALLPSNLFAFEDAPPNPKAASPVGEDIPPRALPFDAMGFVAPQSPMSSGSVSTSPRSSFNHIPAFSSFSPGPRDSSLHLELERNSTTTISPIGTNRPIGAPNGEGIEEGESAAPKSNSRRFVNLLSNSFNRQRGKTVGFEGGPPALGQLRPSESHSFPKNDLPGLDPIGTRRRSGSHGSWANSLDFLHGTSRRTKPLERTNSDRSRRSATFNQFSPSFDPIDPNKLFDQPVSPRPSSIASFDNPLPAPSSDASAAFGWPSADHFQGNRLSGVGGANWTDFRTGRISQSRPVSRPISPGANASTSSLSLFPGHVGYFASSTSTSGRPITPRLNPAAPTFQSRMSTPVRTRSRSIERDSASINTDISGLSGTSLESVPTKESILSRISALSRKTSNSKFNLSWGRGRRKDAGVDDELEEEPIVDSATSSKGSLWGGWKKDGDQESEDEDSKGRLTPLAKESSPWLKGSQSGFFGAIGRAGAKKGDSADEDVKEREKGKNVKEKVKEKEKDDVGEKKGLGIFRRKAEKEKDREDAMATDTAAGVE